MTTWLNRQEAVHRFQAFLDWASPPTPEEPAAPGQGDKEDEDGDNVMDEEVATGEQPQQYLVAKKPALAGVTVRELVRDFGCKDFVHALEEYLGAAARSRAQHLPIPAQFIYKGTRFALYKRISVFLPPMRRVSPLFIKDTNRAAPAQPARPLRPAVPACFDTVLVRESPRAPGSQNPLDGTSG